MSLTKHDKTRFLERGFTVVENIGRNLRLIKRDDARQAISIKWEDLPALRELITLALDDGPMVIGRDISGQNAENAVEQMRSRCVEVVEKFRQRIQYEGDEGVREAMFGDMVIEMESISLEEQNHD